MADKEERIFVFTTKKYTIKETTEDGVIVDGFIEPRDKAKMYTRREAIEVMAKALCHRHCPEKVCTSCDEWEKYGTKEDAETALNALLEGGKK